WRRPDLQYLTLDCANTTTRIPYVDLVNEILESSIALGESAANDTAGATADEQRAKPVYTPRAGGGRAGMYAPASPATAPLVVRVDPTLDIPPTAGSPMRSFPPETDSAAWSARVVPEYSEQYTIIVRASGFVALWWDTDYPTSSPTVSTPGSQAPQGVVDYSF